MDSSDWKFIKVLIIGMVVVCLSILLVGGTLKLVSVLFGIPFCP